MRALKTLILVSLVFLVSCSPKEVPIDLLVEMQGIKYKVDSDTPFTGISFENHDNGQIKERINYKDGKLQSKENYEDGKLQYIDYRDGEGDGLWESYHENGQLAAKYTYKDGKLDGLMESYHDNGQLMKKGTYKDGKREGRWKSYNENGEDVSNSQYQSFHGNGQLKEKGTYKDGVEEFWNEAQKKAS